MICERWDGKTCRRLSLRYIVLLRDRTLGTQVPGVRSPAEQGTGDIQQVCLMQTRFRSPHLPPGKRQMPLFSGRPRTRNLQPSLYDPGGEQYTEVTVSCTAS